MLYFSDVVFKDGVVLVIEEYIFVKLVNFYDMVKVLRRMMNRYFVMLYYFMIYFVYGLEFGIFGFVVEGE